MSTQGTIDGKTPEQWLDIFNPRSALIATSVHSQEPFSTTCSFARKFFGLSYLMRIWQFQVRFFVQFSFFSCIYQKKVVPLQREMLEKRTFWLVSKTY